MAPSKSILSASKKAVDPALDALFASSFGPVEPRAKPKYEKLIEVKPRDAPAPKPVKPLTKEEEEAAEEAEDDDDDEGEDDDNEDDEEEEEEVEATPEKPKASKRKRKGRGEDDEDLEGRYFDKLEREIDGPAEKRAKRADKDNEDEDKEMADADADKDSDDDDAQPIVHESLLNPPADAEEDDEEDDKTEQSVEKASRTVFLSNVSLKAVTDKAAKRKLTLHLEKINGVEKKEKKEKKGKKEDKKEEKTEEKEEKAEEKKEEEKIVESIRFRSVPFASAALPKRAAYITGATMAGTAQSANAYVVYATVAQARLAVKNLNGTVILDRHLRADSVAHPTPVDHRRCVFVGNLGFVDDETVVNDEGETSKKRKTPMDVEEGLWRTFGKHAGRVESVRVVRDPVTRVGKGIAYVQFYDGTSVEAALLLAEKKFPPLLPRALRVSRCKAPHKTARALERVQIRGDAPKREPRFKRGAGGRNKGDSEEKTGYKRKATAEEQTQAGRAAKLLGKQAAGSTMVFEGMRARVGGVSLFKKNKNNKKQAKAAGGANGGKPASGNDRRRAERAKNWKGKPARGGKE